MVNKSKAKGTSAESAVRDYLQANGYPYCERLPVSGGKDRGDITGVDPRLVIEVKSTKEILPGPWLKEANLERDNAGAEVGVVWAKRRLCSSPADWFVFMDGATFVRLLKEMTHG